MAFRPSTLASSTGPKPDTAARRGTPPAPESDSSSTGAADGAQSCASSAVRARTRSSGTPGAAMPARSPFMSAANTGLPAADTCSAMSCRVLVLPVPVAPAMSPWRFMSPSGMPTCTPVSGAAGSW